MKDCNLANRKGKERSKNSATSLYFDSAASHISFSFPKVFVHHLFPTSAELEQTMLRDMEQGSRCFRPASTFLWLIPL